MSVKELEELVSTIRQYIQGARNRNDVFEYCRLCDELTMAEAELANIGCGHYPPLVKPAINARLALI